MNTMSKFLSNKWNLWGVYALCYILIGYMLELIGMTFTEMFIAYFFMAVANTMTYIYGVGRGMMLSAMNRPEFIRELDKMNEIVRKEDKRASNKKRKSSKKKKGCGSGGCKNC